METKPVNFTFKKENGKDLNCLYFFSHEGVNKGTGEINLYIKPNDPEKPDLNHLKIAVKEELMNESSEELNRIVQSELASYYIIGKAAEK